jgi:hypothetical protein
MRRLQNPPRRIARIIAVLGGVVMGSSSPAALAQTPPPQRIVVRPGATAVFDSAACVVPKAPPPGGVVEVARVNETKAYAVYRAPPGLAADAAVTIEKGPAENAAKSGCEPATQASYTFGVDQTPTVSDEALRKSFTVLVAAFAVALLLESAFALLFNWRLFQELLVGKAWRTPILFLGALAVVRLFHLDLMAALFDAYNPGVRPPSGGGGYTSVLTAMILAGGSVGVNRILVGLGFRSQIRPDVAAVAPVNQNEAWISVLVRQKRRDGGDVSVAKIGPADVNVNEVSPAPTDVLIATTVGIVPRRALRTRLREMLFGNRLRVPRTGGMTVTAKTPYRITVCDRSANDGVGQLYDVSTGRPVSNPGEAKPLAFGPRSIVDLEVTLP